jgi:hypothetical protein
MKDEDTGTVGWLVHGPPRRKRRRSLAQYLALYVTVMCAVAGGMILADWIIQSVAEAPRGSFAQRAGHVASEAGSELKTIVKQATAKVKGGSASSEMGRELSQQCDDWTRAYEEGHTSTARAEMERNCRRYKEYLTTARTSR